MFEFLKKMELNLDLKSVFFTLIFTLLLAPLFFVVRKIVIKYIKEWGEYFIDGIMHFCSIYIKQSLAASLSLKRYCKLQLGNDSVKFLNIPSSQDISLDIDKIFVNLTISYNDENENEFNHYDFLTIGNRIKVMGDPGSGKSSLIKRVFRSNCLLGLKHPRKSKMPVLVELKNINTEKAKGKELGQWLYNYIKDEVGKNKVYKIDDCFENYAINKGLLILLDGLDEVSSKNYNKISECINGLSVYLSELGENNSIVLTMRTQFYQQIKSDYTVNFPHNTFLKPFTPSDIYEFLSRWHFSRDAEKNISRVYKDLTDRPTLREMCSNPLILSMYVAEDQISKGTVSPESRTQFYRKITEELISKRRLMQKSNIPGSYSSLKEQREKILGRIAYDHLIDVAEPSNSLSWKNAIIIIKNIMECDDQKAEDIFNEISKETGLITEERQKETFRFIHLTFCEFMAAFEVSQGAPEGWDQLLKLHRKFFKNIEEKSRLIEVIPFASGLLPRAKREQTLFDVAKLNDSTLMSRCFLETKLYNHKTWPAFIINSRKNLLEYRKDNFDERWLQDLHIFNVVVRDSQLSSENINVNENIDLNEFYKNLLENEKTSLNKILSSFASQDAAAVFRMAEMGNIDLLKEFPALIIQNCDQPPFLGLIKEKIAFPSNDYINEWAALLCEAALQKRLISYTLYNMQANDFLNRKIETNSSYVTWWQMGILPKNFLTQCLTLANNHRLDKSITKRLNILQEVKAPKELPLRVLANPIVLLLIIIPIMIVSMSILFTTIKISNEKSLSQLPFLFLSLVLNAIPLFILNYKTSLRKLYRILVNVDIENENPPKNSFDKFIRFLFMPNRPEFITKKERNIIHELKKLRGESHQ